MASESYFPRSTSLEFTVEICRNVPPITWNQFVTDLGPLHISNTILDRTQEVIHYLWTGQCGEWTCGAVAIQRRTYKDLFFFIRRANRLHPSCFYRTVTLLGEPEYSIDDTVLLTPAAPVVGFVIPTWRSAPSDFADGASVIINVLSLPSTICSFPHISPNERLVVAARTTAVLETIAPAEAIREFLRASRGVVSGDPVSCAFANLSGSNDGIEVVIPRSRKALAKHFIVQAGFDRQATAESAGLDATRIRFRRSAFASGQAQQISLVMCPPHLTPKRWVLRQTATHRMNWIAADTAVCNYPNFTMRGLTVSNREGEIGGFNRSIGTDDRGAARRAGWSYPNLGRRIFMDEIWPGHYAAPRLQVLEIAL